MKKLILSTIYILLIISVQRSNMDLSTTPKDSFRKNTQWTKVQEDAKGKAGVT
jgi:hypothetical protein